MSINFRTKRSKSICDLSISFKFLPLEFPIIVEFAWLMKYFPGFADIAKSDLNAKNHVFCQMERIILSICFKSAVYKGNLISTTYLTEDLFFRVETISQYLRIREKMNQVLRTLQVELPLVES